MVNVETLKKLMRRAFPGFPGAHQLQLGEVVGFPKISREETLSDLFKSSFAVDVKLLDAKGAPLSKGPVLQSVPLPVPGAGDARGFYALPELGARVLLAFANGSVHLPHIVAVYASGKALPPIKQEAFLICTGHGDCFSLNPAQSLIEVNQLEVSAHSLTIKADAMKEQVGSRKTEVNGDATEIVQGQKDSLVLGAVKRKSASVKEVAIDDISIATGGKMEATAITGDIVLSASAGKVALQTTIAQIQVDALGKIQLSQGAVELIALLVELLTALLAETHSTGVGPSGPPLNAADYTRIQILLEQLKAVV